MALVSCPECKKEVSDSAKSCPNCGFGIDAYFKKIQCDNEEAERRIEIEQDKKNAEENMRKLEKERLNNIKMPPKPSSGILASLIIVLMWIIVFLLAIVWANHPADDSGFSSMLLIIALFSLSIFPAMITGFIVYVRKSMEEDYDLAISDFEAYKKKKIKSQDDAKEHQQREISNRINELARNKCPHCGSFETKPITTLNRAVSVGAVGLASSKIGKTWECKKCGYKW